MKYLLFTLMVGGVLGGTELNLPPKVFYNLNEARDLFDKYVVEYNKQYDNGQYDIHLAIFKDNLEKLNKLNRGTNLTVYAINQFTDLTFEEISSRYMGMAPAIASVDLKEYKPLGFAPDSLDYRNNGYVSEVKNQGHCNTCYIFSAIGNIEGQYAKAHGNLISLSEQQVLDCDPDAVCESGGIPDRVMNFLAQQGGSMSTQDYPYMRRKGSCNSDQSKIVVKVTGGSRLSVASEDDLKDALSNYGPLSIGLQIDSDFSRYTGGIFHGECQRNGGHGVLLVGYDSAGETPYWIIKNSWGANWGEQGYIRMAMGKSLCDIGSYVASATVA